jgi:hypothetical protein
MRKSFLLAASVALAAAVWLTDTVRSQESKSAAESRATVRIRFGITDTQPSKWDGTISAAGGEIASVRHWRPRPGDRIEGDSRFAIETRKGMAYAKRPWEIPFEEPQQAYLLIPGLIVEVKGSPTTRLRFETDRGIFAVSPFALEAGRVERYLDGGVLVDRTPAAERLSEQGSGDADFATLAAHPGGEIWAAWVTFQNNGNRVMARRFDGTSWAPPVRVSTDHNDIFLVKAAREKSGAVWFIWSAQVNGNFDLYARKWDGRAWSAVERLTEDPQPDIYPVMTTDAQGNAWVAWQGARNGKFRIFV